jgi:hypothetical protein
MELSLAAEMPAELHHIPAKECTLETDRQDLTADEIWRTYMLLTRVEAAFRAMKSPLLERPIFHHLQDRTQTHIFLCVLASAGFDREEIPGSRHPYFVVDPAPAAQYSPGGHRGSADRGWKDPQDPQSYHPGAGAQRDLRHTPDSDGGDKAGEDLARDLNIVTE